MPVTVYRRSVVVRIGDADILTDDVISVQGWQGSPLMRVRTATQGGRVIVWEPVPGQGLPAGQITSCFENGQRLWLYFEEHLPTGSIVVLSY